MNLTSKNTAVLHNFIYDLAFSSVNSSSVHFSIDLVFMELPRTELQITIPTNNPVLLDACCPAIQKLFHGTYNDCLE